MMVEAFRMAADPRDARLARVEGTYELVDKRLATVENRLAAIDVDMRAGFQALRTELHGVRTELSARMDRQFLWLLGLMIIAILSPVAARSFGH